MGKQGEFNWEKIYAEIPLENMGWFHEALDPDLEAALERLQLSSGTFLDVGTGAGTQAHQLSKKGFTVTGTDISLNAVKKARLRYEEAIAFIQDDILDSKLTGQFDFVFDRGCFHCINPEKRKDFVQTVSNKINANGILFLKCFNQNNPTITGGPFQFSEKMIRAYFEESFTIERVTETEYQGKLSSHPKSLFFVMKKKP